MGQRFLNFTKRKAIAERKRRIAISSFTIFLLTLAFFLWYYILITIVLSSSCEFAANWVSGWFDYGSPLQLFAFSFLLAFVIWIVRLVAYWREKNIIETVLQGVFILGFAISLGFVKAMIFPFATPSFKHANFIANLVSPVEYIEQEAIEGYQTDPPPPWPYDFPTPPSYSIHPIWSKDFNPGLDKVFTSTKSPTLNEYSSMQECAARFRARVADHDRALAEFEDWYDKYQWRVDPKYFSYAWD